MKKLYCVLICLCIAVLFCACNKQPPEVLVEYASPNANASVNPKSSVDSQEPEDESEEETRGCPRTVRIKGVNYYDTGKGPGYQITCGTMDGYITSSVPQTEMPTEDNQSNFGEGFGFQISTETSYNVLIDDEWREFSSTYPEDLIVYNRLDNLEQPK